MSDQNKYALNTVSGVVAKVDADILNHPVLGANLLEVEEPSACIPCGIQPKTVTPVATGIEVPVDTGDFGSDPEEPSEPRKAAKSAKEAK